MFPPESQPRVISPEAFTLSVQDARPAEPAARWDMRAATALHGQVVINFHEDVQGYERGGRGGAEAVNPTDMGASTSAETKSIHRLCTRRTLVRPFLMSCTLRDSVSVWCLP